MAVLSQTPISNVETGCEKNSPNRDQKSVLFFCSVCCSGKSLGSSPFAIIEVLFSIVESDSMATANVCDTLLDSESWRVLSVITAYTGTVRIVNKTRTMYRCMLL